MSIEKAMEKAAISLQFLCIPYQEKDVESIQFMANAVQDMLLESRKDLLSSNDAFKLSNPKEASWLLCPLLEYSS